MTNKIQSIMRAFAHQTDGAIAIITAFSILVMIGAAALAVDFGHAHSARSHLQSAVDASALAAANLLDAKKSERKKLGEAIFEANYEQHKSVKLKIEIIDDSLVRVTAERTLPTFLMPVMGKEDVDVHATADVPILNSGYAEVVLVLDYSDSMIDSNKYIRMSEAAQKMIDVVSNNGKNTNVRFGLVPFSAVVRADIPSAYIRSDVTFDGCTMDRQFPFNQQEGVTTGSDAANWGDHSVGGHDCSVVAAANLKVLPLTDSLSNVKSTLASFQPHQWTHIAAGVEFGWQVISPDGVFSGARPYSDKKNVKAVVILTDGMQTAPGWGPSENRTVADAEENLREISDGMKDRKIEVFTVGYDLTDAHTLDLLESCANDDQHYASTDIENGAKQMLSTIAKRIQEKMIRLAN